MRRSTVHSEAPSETAACSMARSRPIAEASVRRSAKGSTITMCASTRPDEGAAQPDLGEEAQEGDAQHDVRDHQRRHEERRHRLAAAEAIARDGERRRHRDGDGNGRGQRAQPEAAPEGRDELGIAGDGVEPAQWLPYGARWVPPPGLQPGGPPVCGLEASVCGFRRRRTRSLLGGTASRAWHDAAGLFGSHIRVRSDGPQAVMPSRAPLLSSAVRRAAVVLIAPWRRVVATTQASGC